MTTAGVDLLSSHPLRYSKPVVVAAIRLVVVGVSVGIAEIAAILVDDSVPKSVVVAVSIRPTRSRPRWRLC